MYAESILNSHIGTIASTEEPHLLISSLIGLLRVAGIQSCQIGDGSLTEKRTPEISKCVQNTMERISALLANDAVLEVGRIFYSLTAADNDEFIRLVFVS